MGELGWRGTVSVILCNSIDGSMYVPEDFTRRLPPSSPSALVLNPGLELVRGLRQHKVEDVPARGYART